MATKFNSSTGKFSTPMFKPPAPKPAPAPKSAPKPTVVKNGMTKNNPGPPPWAKGPGPGQSSTPKTDHPKTKLPPGAREIGPKEEGKLISGGWKPSGTSLLSGSKPTAAGRLADTARSYASGLGRSAANSARTGQAAPPKPGWSVGKTGRVGSTNTYGVRYKF